jgi:hypothetical protein
MKNSEKVDQSYSEKADQDELDDFDCLRENKLLRQV